VIDPVDHAGSARYQDPRNGSVRGMCCAKAGARDHGRFGRALQTAALRRPGPTERVRNTVGKECFSSGPSPQIRCGSGHVAGGFGRIRNTVASSARQIMLGALRSPGTRQAAWGAASRYASKRRRAPGSLDTCQTPDCAPQTSHRPDRRRVPHAGERRPPETVPRRSRSTPSRSLSAIVDPVR
jgi:hypothetical protein